MVADKGVTQRLVSFALEHDGPISSDTLRRAVVPTFTDTLAVIAAGATGDVVQRLSARQTALASAGFTRIDDRAFALGAAGHALDYDDTVPFMPGHPSVPVAAALMASLDDLKVSGTDFLNAYAIGVEVSTKLGRAVGMGHYHQGWHATSTHTTFGALLAVARLRRLSPEVTARAIGVAVSLVSGAQCNFGTMTKPLHSGFAARNAVEAILLAQAGITASTSALEAPKGYFQIYSTDVADPECLIGSLAEPWTFVEPGIVLKRWPCCYATHRGILAAQELMARHPIVVDDVQEVSCSVPIGGLRPLPYASPANGLEAKFSMPYALATQLLDGTVRISSFTTEAVQREAIQKLLKSIDVQESIECSPGDPQGLSKSNGTRGAIRLHISLRSGATLETEWASAPGGPDDPFTDGDLATKFVDCLTFIGHAHTEAEELLARSLALPESAAPAEVFRACLAPSELLRGATA